jgi:hypothetical protein
VAATSIASFSRTCILSSLLGMAGSGQAGVDKMPCNLLGRSIVWCRSSCRGSVPRVWMSEEQSKGWRDICKGLEAVVLYNVILPAEKRWHVVNIWIRFVGLT